MKRLVFLGAVNNKNEPKGGEEYKNQILVKQFMKYFDVDIIDTVNWKTNYKVWWEILILVFIKKFDNLVISASSKSTYTFIKLISHFRHKISKTTYFVIGGYFPNAIVDGTFKSKYYKNLKTIIVEGNSLKDKLYNSPNLHSKTYVIPNMKIFDTTLQFQNFPESQINFVFISAITKNKGVDIILKAVKNLNRHYHSNKKFKVNFYGKIDKNYINEFYKELSENTIFHGYLDIIKNSSNAYGILSQNHCMLFPTNWIGEGFPGVIIDAFICGLPVIATKWNMLNEIINENNGILIEQRNTTQLEIAMKKIIEDPELRKKLSNESKLSAKLYHVDNVFPKVIEILG